MKSQQENPPSPSKLTILPKAEILIELLYHSKVGFPKTNNGMLESGRDSVESTMRIQNSLSLSDRDDL